MKAPWSPDRWRGHCKDRIAKHWDNKLQQEAQSKDTLSMLDICSLSVTQPAKLWSMAGLDAVEVKKACIVNYMSLGVYRTSFAQNEEDQVKLVHSLLQQCNRITRALPIILSIHSRNS